MKHPLAELARALAVTVALAAAACSEPTGAERVASARSAADVGDRAGAIVELKSLLQDEPQNGEGRLLLGRLLLAAGDFAAAEKELNLALEHGVPAESVLPELAGALMAQDMAQAVIHRFEDVNLREKSAAASLKAQLAQAYLSTGQIDAADEAAAMALHQQPGHAVALVARARVAASRGQFDEAGQQVDDLLARQPAVAAAWLLKGDLLCRPGGRRDLEAALAAYGKAVSIQPDLLAAHASTITLRLELRDLQGAMAQLAALQKALPRHRQTSFFTALLALQSGDVARGREIAQGLLKGAPNEPRLLLLSAQAEVLGGSLAQAESMLQRAIAAAPEAAPPRRMLAEVLLRSGQYERVPAVLAPLLATKTPDPDTLVLLGRAQLMSGKAATADETLARAAKLKPDDPHVRTSVALARLGKQPSDAALADLEAIAATDVDLTVDLALISARLRRGQFDAALKAVDALAAKQPKTVNADYLRGQIALRRGDKAEARRRFEAALTAEPRVLLAASQLAQLDMADGKPDAARARYEAVAQRDPTNASAMVDFAALIARTGGKREDVVALLEKAIKAQPKDSLPRAKLTEYLLQGGDYDAAMAAAQAAVAALPGNVELLDLLGRVQVLAGDINQAVATFNKLVALQPKSAMPLLRLADAYQAGQKPELALGAVRRAMALEPQSTAVQRAGVIQEMRAGHPAQALQITRRMQADQPAQALGYHMEGEIELAQRHIEPAIAAFRTALTKLNPSESASRLHIALLAAKKNAEADRFAEAWLRDHPGDPVFLFHLADLASEAGDLALAESRYREVLNVAPDSFTALNNIAMLLIRQKKSGSLEIALRAAKLAPAEPAVLDTLAQCYAAAGQLDEAIQTQVRAVAISRGAPTFRLQLARLYLQADEKNLARGQLEALAKLDKSFPEQAEVAILLKKSAE